MDWPTDNTQSTLLFLPSRISAMSKIFLFFKITQKFLMNLLEFHDNFCSYFSTFSTESSQQNLLVASQKFSVSSQIKTFSFCVLVSLSSSRRSVSKFWSRRFSYHAKKHKKKNIYKNFSSCHTILWQINIGLRLKMCKEGVRKNESK